MICHERPGGLKVLELECIAPTGPPDMDLACGRKGTSPRCKPISPGPQTLTIDIPAVQTPWTLESAWCGWRSSDPTSQAEDVVGSAQSALRSARTGVSRTTYSPSPTSLIPGRGTQCHRTMDRRRGKTSRFFTRSAYGLSRKQPQAIARCPAPQTSLSTIHPVGPSGRIST